MGDRIETLRKRLFTLNRCWSDMTCDCAQQKLAEQIMAQYDALAARLAEAERLLQESLLRAEADLMSVGHMRDSSGRARAMADLETWVSSLRFALRPGDSASLEQKP